MHTCVYIDIAVRTATCTLINQGLQASAESLQSFMISSSASSSWCTPAIAGPRPRACKPCAYAHMHMHAMHMHRACMQY